MSLVKENDRVGKSVSKNDPKGLTDVFCAGCRKVEKRSGFVIYSHLKDSSFIPVKSDTKF